MVYQGQNKVSQGAMQKVALASNRKSKKKVAIGSTSQHRQEILQRLPRYSKRKQNDRESIQEVSVDAIIHRFNIPFKKLKKIAGSCDIFKRTSLRPKIRDIASTINPNDFDFLAAVCSDNRLVNLLVQYKKKPMHQKLVSKQKVSDGFHLILIGREKA